MNLNARQYSILVIEKSPSFIAGILPEADSSNLCLLTITDSWKTAMDLCSAHKYDLILAEFDEEHEDTPRLVYELKALQRNLDVEDVKIIAFSQFLGKRSRYFFIASGCKEFISKPSKETLLLNTIYKFVHVSETYSLENLLPKNSYF